MTSVLVYAEAWGFGGIETFLLGLFRTLVPRGYRFTLLTTWDWNDTYDSELASLGVERYVVFKGHRPGQVRRLKEGTAIFERLLKERDFDVVHVNTMNGMGFVYACIARRCGIPVRIVHSHNSDVGEGVKAIKRLTHLIARTTLSGAETARLACSEEAGRHLFGDRTFRIVHNGFDVNNFAFSPEARAACRAELSVPADVPLLGNPSRLAPAKNPLFQIEVFSEFLKLDSSAYYLMQGTGELEHEAKALADELGIAGRIVWFEPRPNVAPLYSAMDLMLFPSLFEGLSLVSIEAQASGLPVLVSNDISPETAVTNLVRRKPISDGAREWAMEIAALLATPFPRCSYASIVRESGYDRVESSTQLTLIYSGSDRVLS